MICKYCGIDKDIADFYKSNKSRCKECYKEQSKKYWKKYPQDKKDLHYAKTNAKRDIVSKYRKPCAKCGDTRLYVIDFHHIDPDTKKFGLATTRFAIQSLEVIEAEINKCICLCRNCHHEFHHFYGKHPKNPISDIYEYLGKEIKNG